MATVLVRPTNGVSFGIKRVITPQDVTDGQIVFDFGVDYYLVPSFSMVNSGDSVVDPAGISVQLDPGKITLTSSSFVVDYAIYLMAQRSYEA